MHHIFRHALLAFIVATSSWAQAAFEGCQDQFPGKQPPVITATQHRDICFNSFAVLHSGATKTPVYVVERLNKDRLLDAKGEKRTNKFYEEARLPIRDRATLNDYKGSGFDRGHMAPAGDMPNPEAMAQSFSLSNVVPQSRQHNQRLWAKIENDTRKYVMRASGDVFVFTGPWYKNGHQTIGAGRVAVPDVIWKMVYDASTGRSWVFWSENRDDAQMMPPISKSEFEARSGLLLF